MSQIAATAVVKSVCQGFEDRSLSCSDGNSGVQRQLLRRLDQLGCKRMLRRRQHNTILCSGHRNNCSRQKSVFVLPITGSTSGSRQKKLDPRPDPVKIVDPVTRDPWPGSSSATQFTALTEMSRSSQRRNKARLASVSELPLCLHAFSDSYLVGCLVFNCTFSTNGPYRAIRVWNISHKKGPETTKHIIKQWNNTLNNKKSLKLFGLCFVETIPSPWLGFLRGVFPANHWQVLKTKWQNIST